MSLSGDGSVSGSPVFEVASHLRGSAIGPRTAIVHDWLPVYGGAERVLEQMLGVVPEADLYSLIDFLPDDQRGFLGGRPVQTSFIQRAPFARAQYRSYLPLAPFAVEQFDLTDYQVVVSSSYVVAKGALTRADQLHLCYIHTPVRYAWDLQFEYLREGGMEKGVKSVLARLIFHYLRLFDAGSANRVDSFVANSKHVARRVWKTYRRRAQVVYPPVDVDEFSLCEAKEDYYVTMSRLVPYKRVDLLIRAFNAMPEKELIVIGGGPDLRRLQALAGPNVTVLGFQPREAVRHYLQHARAFVYAAEEDFGITLVEAQACGTPVVAYGCGGAEETVLDGATGILFPEQSADGVRRGIERFETLRAEITPDRAREHAEGFSSARFRREFGGALDRAYTRHRRRSASSFAARRRAAVLG